MTEPNFTFSDDGPIRAFEKRMHAEGWADFVTLAREKDGWTELARAVNEYGYSIDDYTNDLYARNYLERALGELPKPFSTALRDQIRPADDAFRVATIPDDVGLLGTYHRIDESSGWWWRRIPAAGPLAEYLRGEGSSGGE